MSAQRDEGENLTFKMITLVFILRVRKWGKLNCLNCNIYQLI